ncbi:hypothetical protein E2C01_073534 [Portunus trituberculatus]|uniref:Uncharacterized protein n=1 Tax=Portunus trituberculatus TaxID=210409 RepID=A0A5B7I9N8_PORTR|nr:hypothetical protein [Portunus trituberculatus]
MGNQCSRLHVEARLNQLGDGELDTMRLSRPRSACCCGWGRYTIAGLFHLPGRNREGNQAPRVG